MSRDMPLHKVLLPLSIPSFPQRGHHILPTWSVYGLREWVNPIYAVAVFSLLTYAINSRYDCNL